MFCVSYLAPIYYRVGCIAWNVSVIWTEREKIKSHEDFLISGPMFEHWTSRTQNKCNHQYIKSSSELLRGP
jgi:hypothetical protein